MRICCLTPTLGRPVSMLQNCLACFLSQDYGDKFLLIFDDGGQIQEQEGDGFRVVSCHVRYPSIVAKYAAMLDVVGDKADSYVVWDDDDVYRPEHLSCHAAVLEQHAFSYPSRVYIKSGAKLIEKPSRGCYHGSIAFTRAACEKVGGWGTTQRADFDQQLIRRLLSLEDMGDPVANRKPTYYYRWSHSGGSSSPSI